MKKNLLYCLKCKGLQKDNPGLRRDKGREVLLSKSAVCNNKRSRFIRKTRRKRIIN